MALDDGSQSKGSLVGKALGQYQIIDVLGKGGMATVYKAYQPSLERCIALKVLFPHFAEPEFVARFKREALAAARLNHPSIVHVYDAGEIDGYYYIAMEYIEGGTLKDRLDERGHEPLDSDTILQVVEGIGSALEYAHRQGIVHRDIKPANIMFTRDSRVVLADLGLAKFFEATDLTQMTALIGTPYYMSPEQARSQGVDARSDLYSFGVVLYEMLTGRVPFEADTPWMAIHQHIYEAPPPVRERNPLISEDVAQVVTKALAKEPSQRYQHAEELVQALVQTQQPVAASRPAAPPNTLHPPQSAAPRRGVSPFLLWAGGVLSVLVLLGAALLWNPGGQLWPWRGASAVLSMTATPTSSPLTYALFGTGTPSLVPPTVTASPTQSATATALPETPTATLSLTLVPPSITTSPTTTPEALTPTATPSVTTTPTPRLLLATATATRPPATATPTATTAPSHTPTNTPAPQQPAPSNTPVPSPSHTPVPPTNTFTPAPIPTTPVPSQTPRPPDTPTPHR